MNFSLNKKGFTMFEVIVAMFLVGILLNIGISLVSYSSQTTFMEIGAAVTRNRLNENFLFMSQEFQSAPEILISNDSTRIYAKVDETDFYSEYALIPGDANDTRMRFVYAGDRSTIKTTGQCPNALKDTNGDGVFEVVRKEQLLAIVSPTESFFSSSSDLSRIEIQLSVLKNNKSIKGSNINLSLSSRLLVPVSTCIIP